MTSSAVNWGGTSRYVDIEGASVHYMDFGGPATGTRLVLVHGLGGAHLNWALLAPQLAERSRVVAVDLVGFGLTHPQGRPATVRANAAMLDRFVRDVVGTPVVLVGNSMGALVSIIEATTHPDVVAGLVLIDPALPPVLGALPDPQVMATLARFAVPGLGRYVLARGRVSARHVVQQTLKLCCADPSTIPADLVEASVALARERAGTPGLDGAFLDAARSMFALHARQRTAWAMIDSVRVPVLLIHGARDRLVPVTWARVAERRNPQWTVSILPGVGHVPMLEVPDLVADLMTAWLDGPGGDAGRAASPAA